MGKCASLGFGRLLAGAFLLASAASGGALAEPLATPSPGVQMAAGRDTMIVVGSTTMTFLVDAIADRLSQNTGLPRPIIRSQGTSHGAQAFCDGTGPDTPDILVMPRRLRVSELERCRKNGVNDIVDVPFGYSALVIVKTAGDPGDYSMTKEELYRSIAAEWPDGDYFNTNTVKKWSDISPRLPKNDIKWVLPNPKHGQRNNFDDLFLQAACRDLPAIYGIFQAGERVRQCLTLHRDGRVREVHGPYVPTAITMLAKAEPGTLGILPFRFASLNPATVSMVTIDGVTPSHQSIERHEYPFNNPLHFYIKVAHMKNFAGDGLVSGLREFITEVTRESTTAPNGYLDQTGVVPLEESERKAARESALRLERFTR